NRREDTRSRAQDRGPPGGGVRGDGRTTRQLGNWAIGQFATAGRAPKTLEGLCKNCLPQLSRLIMLGKHLESRCASTRCASDAASNAQARSLRRPSGGGFCLTLLGCADGAVHSCTDPSPFTQKGAEAAWAKASPSSLRPPRPPHRRPPPRNSAPGLLRLTPYRLRLAMSTPHPAPHTLHPRPAHAGPEPFR